MLTVTIEVTGSIPERTQMDCNKKQESKEEVRITLKERIYGR